LANIADQLIDHDTGSLDRLAILECATLRAQREWGGKNYPPIYLREALRWAEDRANHMQIQWRWHRGLPTGVPVVWTEIPTWGASGDSFHE